MKRNAEEHQAEPEPRKPDVGGIAGERLLSFIERVERLEEDRKATANDIKDVYSEAKSAGFDTSIIRGIIRDRRRDTADLEEYETLDALYRRAIGM